MADALRPPPRLFDIAVIFLAHPPRLFHVAHFSSQLLSSSSDFPNVESDHVIPFVVLKQLFPVIDAGSWIIRNVEAR